MLKEFKEFAMRGNVIDLAVGVVIGSAFSKIVTSMVDDIITPAILIPSLKAAKIADLDKLVIPGTAIKYGSFVSTLLSFIVVTFALFLFIKAINMAQRKKDNLPIEPDKISNSEKLLTEIRDALIK